MSLLDKLFSKKCSVCSKKATDKMDDVKYCREHLLVNFRQEVLAYQYCMVVLEPEISADDSYVPFLNFWQNEDVRSVVGESELASLRKLYDEIGSHDCERCEERAKALYLPNTVFKSKMTPDYANLEKYPKQYFCVNHIWEKLAEIVNKTSRSYGEEGDIGITGPAGIEGGLYASSISY